jgi:hypothetical protein
VCSLVKGTHRGTWQHPTLNLRRDLTLSQNGVRIQAQQGWCFSVGSEGSGDPSSQPPSAIFARAPGSPPTGQTYPTPRNSVLPSTGLPVLLDQRFAIDPRLPSLPHLAMGEVERNHFVTIASMERLSPALRPIDTLPHSILP